MVSLMREDNELIRARGDQLHTIRTLIKASEVTAQPRTKNWWGRGTLPFLSLQNPAPPLSLQASPDSPPPLGPAHPRALLSPSSETDLSWDPGFTARASWVT